MSEKSEKWSESMSSAATLDEASGLLRKIAGARRADENINAVILRVARQLQGWTYSRVKDVWYRDKRVVVRATEVEQLRALADAERRDRRKNDNELAELRATVARLARIEEYLQRTDPEFFVAEISAARDQAGQEGRVLGTRRA